LLTHIFDLLDIKITFLEELFNVVGIAVISRKEWKQKKIQSKMWKRTPGNNAGTALFRYFVASLFACTSQYLLRTLITEITSIYHSHKMARGTSKLFAVECFLRALSKGEVNGFYSFFILSN
jgi:hypothetical protein